MPDGPTGTGRRVVVAVAVALLAGAAAATPIALLGAGRWDGPGLADLDLGAAGADAADGRWTATDLERDGRAVALDGDRPVWLALETVVAGLSGHAGCGPLLGSFTLTADGAASFTVPGSGDPTCPPARRTVDDAVRAALHDVTAWSVEGSSLTLTGPSWTVRLIRS